MSVPLARNMVDPADPDTATTPLWAESSSFELRVLDGSYSRTLPNDLPAQLRALRWTTTISFVLQATYHTFVLSAAKG